MSRGMSFDLSVSSLRNLLTAHLQRPRASAGSSRRVKFQLGSFGSILLTVTRRSSPATADIRCISRPQTPRSLGLPNYVEAAALFRLSSRRVHTVMEHHTYIHARVAGRPPRVLGEDRPPIPRGGRKVEGFVFWTAMALCVDRLSVMPLPCGTIVCARTRSRSQTSTTRTRSRSRSTLNQGSCSNVRTLLEHLF